MGAFDLHTNVTTKRPLTMILCSEKTKPNQNIHISVRMRVHVSIAKPPHRSKHTHTHSVARTLTHTHNANEQQHKASHQQPNNNTTPEKTHDQLICGAERQTGMEIDSERVSLSSHRLTKRSQWKNTECPNVAMFYVFKMFCECVEKTKSVCVDKATGWHTVNSDATVKGTSKNNITKL